MSQIEAQDWDLFGQRKIKNLNTLVELLNSRFFEKYFHFSQEYMFYKFHNRFSLFYKKQFSEENLFEKESSIFLAKIITSTDSILDEEFFIRLRNFTCMYAIIFLYQFAV